MGQVIGDKGFISGHLHVIIENRVTGALREYDFDNTVTQAMLNRFAQWGAGLSPSGQNPVYAPSKFMMGTGSGTPAVGDIALFTPNTSSLISIAVISTNANVTTLTINYPPNYIVGTFTEGGLMDINSVLLTHLMLTPSIAIGANEAVTFIYTLRINAA